MGATVAEVLGYAIAASVARIVEQEPVIRADLDPEGIHQGRVGTRRLRSDLRTFRPVLEAGWAEPRRAELAWLAGELGEVRDRDVLLELLRTTAARLGDDELAAGLLDRLARERARAQRRAVAAISSPRYHALLAALTEPPSFAPGTDRSAAALVPELAGTAFGKLRKAVRRLPDEPGDDELHQLRIRAKRARYAADVARPVVGKPAKRTAKAIGRLQGVLGDHHDCVVARAWLRSALPSATKLQAFAAGQLVADLGRQADAHRAAWPAAWERVAAGGTPSWLDG